MSPPGYTYAPRDNNINPVTMGKYIVRTHINRSGTPYYIEGYIYTQGFISPVVVGMVQGTWDITRALVFTDLEKARAAAADSGREAIVIELPAVN